MSLSLPSVQSKACLAMESMPSSAYLAQQQRIAMYSVACWNRRPPACRNVFAHTALLRLGAAAVPRYIRPLLPLRINPSLPPYYVHCRKTTLANLLLAYFRANRTASNGPTELPFHVVTRRGNLSRLALNNENWRIGVQRLGSTLFLRRLVDLNSLNVNETGFQFERACAYTRRSARMTSTLPSGPHSYFHFVASALQLGNHRILLESETDVVSGGAHCPLDNLKLIELKLMLKKGDHFVPLRSQRKSIWIQSMLGGIDRLLIGIRDDSYLVNEIVDFSLDDLIREPARVKLLSRVTDALAYLDRHVRPDQVYIFQRTADKGHELLAVEKTRAFVSLEMLHQAQEWAKSADD